MVKKILDNKIKMAVIICATVLAGISMITGNPIPDWVRSFGMALFGVG